MRYDDDSRNGAALVEHSPSAIVRGRQYATALLRNLGLLPIAEEMRFWLNVSRNHARNRAFSAELPKETFPPARISYDAYSFVDYENYYISGRKSAEVVLELIRGRIKFEGARILEWGCGPGRIVRHLAELAGNLGIECFGTDYNRVSIEWCSRAIMGVTFAVNDLCPPLSFPDNFFDVIYSVSVFTHLSEQMHYAWLKENFRVVKDGGLIIFTTQGDRMKYKLLASELRQYEAGELVVRSAATEGARTYSAFQSPAFVTRKLLPTVPDLELIQHEMELQLAGTQDIWVLKKCRTS
jgi:ubiquinone/menaquinone biosynthesis C-methylase UbiE